MAAKIEKKSKNDDMNTVYMSVVALIALVAIVGVAAMVLGIRSTTPTTIGLSALADENDAGDAILKHKPGAQQGTMLTGVYVLDGTRYKVTYSSYKKSITVSNLDNPSASSALAILFGISPLTGTMRCDGHAICAQAPVAVAFDTSSKMALFKYPSKTIAVQLK